MPGGNSRRSDTAEDMLKVLMVESGTPGAPTIEGPLTSLLVAVVQGSREESELKLVSRASVATKTTTEGFLKMEP